MKRLIFIFSLPRSGSTLLQRILMSHPEIASVAEPWLLLPFCYVSKPTGVLTEYSHTTCFSAFEDFIKNLPNKDCDYYKALRTFAWQLYEKHCENRERYFLDKTPRYYNIIPQIAKIFPDAKFIFLFRNPVHVFASIISTWSENRFKKLYVFYRDIYVGPQKLAEGYMLLKDKSYALRYEDFVLNPEKYLREICEYLEIDFVDNMMIKFHKQDTKGRMGDPIGIKKYKTIKSETLNKWKLVFNTPFRKIYVKRYISKIDDKVLEIMGYSKNQIINEIENLDTKVIYFYRDLVDFLDLIYANLVRFLKLNLFFGKRITRWVRYEYLS